ncbi:MAG: hypothetical protein ACN4EP_00420 [Sediminibacterium sp.]
MERELIISLHNGQIWFNHKESISYSQTNLPEAAFAFKEEELFWKIRMLGFDKAAGVLLVKVLDYQVAHYKSMYLQDDPKYPVKKLVFEKLDWPELEPLLSYADVNILRPFLLHAPPLFRMEMPVEKLAPPPPVLRVPFNITVKIPIKDIVFGEGKVNFSLQFNYYGPFSVDYNYTFLQESFNFCKEWFIKRFKRNYVNVTASGFVKNGNLDGCNLLSDDLQSINEEMIIAIREIVLKDYVKKVLKEESGKYVRGIIHVDEESGLKNLSPRGSTLSARELEILMSTIMARNARNEKQLAFLSGHTAVQMTHLKFTRPPYKGLIFSFQGKMFMHFVWELLNSNATYIWSFPIDRHSEPDMHEFLEKYISMIAKDGRFIWKKIRTDQLQEGHLFYSVNHYHQSTHLNEGLPEWIDNIEEIICR